MDECFRPTPPPIHPDDLTGPPPGSILISLLGYFSSGTNATTAECLSKTNKRIRVTFWAAHPPRVSCFTVYSPDLEPSAVYGFGRVAPKLVSTEDDLALLRVPICDVPGLADTSGDDYFVYQAGAENKAPSLHLVPPPPPPGDFNDYQVGLLRRRAPDMYFIAILDRFGLLHKSRDKYYLHLYSSETEAWSTKLTTCLDSGSESRQYVYSGKVITIGGDLGSMGWVDPWRGILICDVLLDNGELRYIPLPSPAVPRPSRHADGVACRDAIALEGYIKYFEMCVSPTGGWEAVEWRRKDSWKKWKKHRVIKVSVDPEAEIKEQLTLKKHSGYPALSLHDAGVVYIMDTHSSRDQEVQVIAVDMRKQTLKGVAADYVLRVPMLFSFYRGSGISKHLRRTSSARGNAETSTNEIVQAGKEEVRREGVQSQLSEVHGTSRKCRERHGRCRGST